MILIGLFTLLAAPPIEIGVLRWSETITGQVIMYEGLLAESVGAKVNGREVRVRDRVAGDGPDGIQNQIKQMGAFLDEGIDLLIVQPTDNMALSGQLRRANALKIPVITYDQFIPGGELTAFVTSDNHQAGYLAGEYISHRFADQWKIRLILVEYPHVYATVQRSNGFLAALDARGQPYRVIARYKAVEPEGGREVGAAILRDFPMPGTVDVIFTVNDGGGLSIVEALAEAGRDEIQVATVDGDPRSVENIKAKRLTVIDSAQFCGEIGAEAMRLALRHLRGERVPKRSLMPAFPITAETLHVYPGWAAKPPAAFKLPWPSEEPWWSPKIHVPNP